MAKKIKVLIVDDSPVIQLCLDHILQSDPSIEIIGKVDSGFKVIEFLEHSKTQCNYYGFKYTRNRWVGNYSTYP